jgi:hypothetical protein
VVEGEDLEAEELGAVEVLLLFEYLTPPHNQRLT